MTNSKGKNPSNGAARATTQVKAAANRSSRSNTIPVIDVFAGPGGLGEGFSSFEKKSRRPFRIALSIEMDEHAHQTLLLRSFYRQFPPQRVPAVYYRVLKNELPLSELANMLEKEGGPLWAAWCRATAEARCAELGAVDYEKSDIKQWIGDEVGDNASKPWVLIGGPPCQAYSLIGRASNRRAGYKPEEDRRHRLYQEYVKIIADKWPVAFVMENVKGILSSKLQGQHIFHHILRDLKNPAKAIGRRGRRDSFEYTIYSVVQPAAGSLFNISDPADFLVRCEEYGVPQERHRVILLGIRNDIDVRPHVLTPSPKLTIESVIGDLPLLRSGLSRMRINSGYKYLDDSAAAWVDSIRTQVNGGAERTWLKALAQNGDSRLRAMISTTAALLQPPAHERGAAFLPCQPDLPPSHPLYKWYIDQRIGGVCNHESRLHLNTDLARYLFAACYGRVYGVSPKLGDFPKELLPEHENAEDGVFEDRFRVQVACRPATTITSHIAKDGHYYIHYDPLQCRALSVREAARLQTFPDNYLFCGPRTAQYTQVGNAVPPFLAMQIADIVYDVLARAGRLR